MRAALFLLRDPCHPRQICGTTQDGWVMMENSEKTWFNGEGNGKPVYIMIIQVYALTSNAEEAEQFYEDLQDLLELTLKKRCPFHYRGLEHKSRKSRHTQNNRQIWPWSAK